MDRAQLLIGAVRDRDPELIARLIARLRRRDTDALLVTLAAMVPTDLSPTELLAWCDSVTYLRRHQPRPTAPHGTHAAYNLHRKRGEAACPACLDGEADYTRGRQRRARALAMAEATG